MTETIDQLGPVDWIVVEVPGSNVNGNIARALMDLVDRGVIRILDLLMLKKDGAGALEAVGRDSRRGRPRRQPPLRQARRP